MASEAEEARVDESMVVVRVGTKAYYGYLNGKKAVIIGKCENDKQKRFAIFITH